MYEYSCARLRAAQTLLKLSQIIFRVHPDAVVGRHGYVNVDPVLQKAQLLESFGTFEGFRNQLSQASLNVQGSGWGALTWEPVAQRLIVEQVYDHQSNVGQGAPPLLVLDMWEHAYYLQYKNVKADWVDAFWNIVNWPDVTARFDNAQSLKLL